MSRYRVEMALGTYSLFVEADTEEEARILAEKTREQGIEDYLFDNGHLFVEHIEEERDNDSE